MEKTIHLLALGLHKLNSQVVFLWSLLLNRTRDTSRTRASTVETGVRIQELLSFSVKALQGEESRVRGAWVREVGTKMTIKTSSLPLSFLRWTSWSSG